MDVSVNVDNSKEGILTKKGEHFKSLGNLSSLYNEGYYGGLLYIGNQDSQNYCHYYVLIISVLIDRKKIHHFTPPLYRFE